MDLLIKLLNAVTLNILRNITKQAKNMQLLDIACFYIYVGKIKG